MKTKLHLLRSSPYAAVGLAVACLSCVTSQAQLTPAQINEFKSTASTRVEATTILGGDFGLGSGTYKATPFTGQHTDLDVSKFGGGGDVGDPKPIDDSGIGWQPRIQGSMGTLTARKYFDAGPGPQANDNTETDSSSIQFGGGARFWFGEHLSLAPTIMGMYGHTTFNYYANNPTTKAVYGQAQSLGLINWNVDTWTVRPAANVAYVYTLGRTIFTLSSDLTYYHTESFHSSTSNFKINGDSESWKNLIDVDIPLGKQLFGHELRTGGFFSRTELYDGLKDGLSTDHLYEFHGRVVLDFLGNLWKVQWIGLGGSYMWGSNFHGWAFGADIAFRF